MDQPMPTPRTTVRHHDEAAFDQGLRAFFAYRDLGVAGATTSSARYPAAGPSPNGTRTRWASSSSTCCGVGWCSSMPISVRCGWKPAAPWCSHPGCGTARWPIRTTSRCSRSPARPLSRPRPPEAAYATRSPITGALKRLRRANALVGRARSTAGRYRRSFSTCSSIPCHDRAAITAIKGRLSRRLTAQ
jgi:hypothetical protein